MKELQPSMDDWRQLYDAAVEFKKLKCWEWMLDSYIFGVQNPETNEVGYCCITGNLGEFFALIVYLGSEGLEIYLRAQSGMVLPGDMEAFANQKCLMASFEDREILTKDDLAIIKKLGFRTRGRNQWPQFRSYLPGYAPWYLERDEVKYLTAALRQAAEVAFRFREDPDILVPPQQNRYLVRVPEGTDGEYQWTDKWLEPEPLGDEPEIVIPPINEIRLQKIKKTVKDRGGVWEVDYFFSPTSVGKDDERSYYPYAILYVDSYSGFVLDVDITKSTDYAAKIPNGLMGVIEKTQMRPTGIWVKKEDMFRLLSPVTSPLDIKLELMEELEMVEEAQASMFQFFG